MKHLGQCHATVNAPAYDAPKDILKTPLPFRLSPLPEPILTRFIHLTDLHISHPDVSDPKDLGTSRETLKRVVGLINAMDPQPAFVVASGDLTNLGDVQSYAFLRDILVPLKAPILMAMGNHDLREGYRDVFGGEGRDAPLCHDAVHGGLHVITLDTKVPEKVGGALCAVQFTFLAEALDRHEDLPKLIVMHHAPRVDDAAPSWGTIDMASTQQLADVLKGHQIVGILSGHVHINQIHHWNGIPIHINSGLDSTIDLLERDDLRLLEGTTMGICDYRATGLSVSLVPLSPAQKVLDVIDRSVLLSLS